MNEDKIIYCEYHRGDILWTEPRDVTIDEVIEAYCEANSRFICQQHRLAKNQRIAHVGLLNGSVEVMPLPADREKLRRRLTY